MEERTYTAAEVDQILRIAAQVAVRYLREAQAMYEAEIIRLLLSQPIREES